MIGLFKHLWAFIQVPFKPIPEGLWCGEPFDCILSTFRKIDKNGNSIVKYWHEPFVCNGKCKYKWVRGYVDFKFSESTPTIIFDDFD